MKAVFLVSLLALFLSQPAYSADSGIKIEIATGTTKLPLNEYLVPVTITLTNTSAADLRMTDLDYLTAHSEGSQLLSDNPATEIVIRDAQTSNGDLPQQTLKAGQSADKRVLVALHMGDVDTLTSFRLGFKLSEHSEPVWSSALTVTTIPVFTNSAKRLPLLLEATTDASKPSTVRIKLTNTSDTGLTIEGSGDIDYGDWRSGDRPIGYKFAPIKSNTRLISVDSSLTGCNGDFRTRNKIMLPPGVSWEHNCDVHYEGGTTPTEPVTFRMGIVAPDFAPLWSNEVTVEMK